MKTMTLMLNHYVLYPHAYLSSQSIYYHIHFFEFRVFLILYFILIHYMCFIKWLFSYRFYQPTLPLLLWIVPWSEFNSFHPSFTDSTHFLLIPLRREKKVILYTVCAFPVKDLYLKEFLVTQYIEILYSSITVEHLKCKYVSSMFILLSSLFPTTYCPGHSWLWLPVLHLLSIFHKFPPWMLSLFCTTFVSTISDLKFYVY